jgi:hypothetical protein
VVARALAEAGHRVLVVDERAHVAGNCHSQRDPSTGIMTHVYGPHIFHTANERVWGYVQQFGEWMPYQHRVRAVAKGTVYSLPINLLTINLWFILGYSLTGYPLDRFSSSFTLEWLLRVAACVISGDYYMLAGILIEEGERCATRSQKGPSTRQRGARPTSSFGTPRSKVSD